MDEEIEVQRGLAHTASDWQSWDQNSGLLGLMSVFLMYSYCSKVKMMLDLNIPLRANI